MEESYESKRVLQDFGVVEFGLMPLCHQVSGVWIDVRGVGPLIDIDAFRTQSRP